MKEKTGLTDNDLLSSNETVTERKGHHVVFAVVVQLRSRTWDDIGRTKKCTHFLLPSHIISIYSARLFSSLEKLYEKGTKRAAFESGSKPKVNYSGSLIASGYSRILSPL